MKKSTRDLSREVGLEIGSICGKHLLKLEDLHYGFWTDELEVDITNLHKAQDNYTKFLLSQIPHEVKTILDVGCGTGGIAGKLLGLGYEVDGVSPSPFFAEQARKALGNNVQIFVCRYEDMRTEIRYDLVLFSESFQYIILEQAISKTCALLGDNGYMLISDVFSKDIDGKRLQRGGHKLSKFYQLVTDYGFQPVKDVDITDETSPTIDILGDLLKNVGQPVLRASLRLLAGRYPLAFKLLSWKYRKQLDKMNDKYFGGHRTAENFKRCKSYRLLLYKKAVPG